MKGKGKHVGGNDMAEVRQYRRRMRRRIATEEQAPEKNREGRLIYGGPVPETDTGGRVEHTEALERFTVKELGKLTP